MTDTFHWTQFIEILYLIREPIYRCSIMHVCPYAELLNRVVFLR